MRHAGEARRALSMPTAFNLLGPLTNPAGVRRQVVGVARPDLTELLARALQQLGAARAWVVHGADGLDELSTSGHTKVSECEGGVVRTYYVHPTDFGLPKSTLDALAGGDAAENADLVRQVLDGAPGPRRDVVLMNAAAVLFVAGVADTLPQAVALAAAAIDTGRARARLDQLVRVSHEAATA